MDVVGSAIVISFFFMVTSIFYFKYSMYRRAYGNLRLWKSCETNVLWNNAVVVEARIPLYGECQFNQFIERKLRYVISIYETRTEYGTAHMDKGQCRCSVGMRKYG